MADKIDEKNAKFKNVLNDLFGVDEESPLKDQVKKDMQEIIDEVGGEFIESSISIKIAGKIGKYINWSCVWNRMTNHNEDGFIELTISNTRGVEPPFALYGDFACASPGEIKAFLKEVKES